MNHVGNVDHLSGDEDGSPFLRLLMNTYSGCPTTLTGQEKLEQVLMVGHRSSKGLRQPAKNFEKGNWIESASKQTEKDILQQRQKSDQSFYECQYRMI